MVIVILIGGVFLVVVLGLYLYHVDEFVTEGAAYGYSIGMDKREVFNRASELYDRDYVKIAFAREVRVAQFDSSDWAGLKTLDLWNIYFSLPLNSIRFEFEDGKLRRIYRNRRIIEGM